MTFYDEVIYQCKKAKLDDPMKFITDKDIEIINTIVELATASKQRIIDAASGNLGDDVVYENYIVYKGDDFINFKHITRVNNRIHQIIKDRILDYYGHEFKYIYTDARMQGSWDVAGKNASITLSWEMDE